MLGHLVAAVLADQQQAQLERLEAPYKWVAAVVVLVILLEQWLAATALLVALLLAVVVVAHQLQALTLALAVLAVTASVVFTLGKDNHDAFCNN
jgi:cell division protein FtsW (lipid II flippase)